MDRLATAFFSANFLPLTKLARFQSRELPCKTIPTRLMTSGGENRTIRNVQRITNGTFRGTISAYVDQLIIDRGVESKYCRITKGKRL